MRQDQYFDKMLTRLEKIETALNRIGRTLEAIQKSSKNLPEQDLAVPLNTHVKLNE